MEGVIAVNDLDIVGLMRAVAKRRRRYIAMAMNDIDEIWAGLGFTKEHPSYYFLRKAVLDNLSELSRSIMRDITGDVENDFGVI